MKTEKITTLKIELEGSEIDNFKTALKKVNEENNKAGFDRFSMNSEEVSFVKNLIEKLNS